MDNEEHDNSWNRALTRSERRLAMGIIGWFATCVVTAIISPKLGFALLIVGVLVALVAGLALHIGS